MKFTTTLVGGDQRNVLGMIVPPEVVAALGAGKRPPVKVTINGYAYRSTVAVMGGDFMIGVAAEHRGPAGGVAAGDVVEVTLELDAGLREVAVPQDFAAALDAAGVLGRFGAMAYSHRKEHVRAIDEAKTAETRARRIAKAIEKISGG
ncbi:MAG: YdeI/OmpD-associated family protein [Rhodobacterales bacterium]|nr:YdeI/OmpD-associated family protein [Rhodobacterales bacterium]